MSKKKKPYTDAELRRFDRITKKLSSIYQMDRILARFEIDRFVKKHGLAKCKVMFVVLKKRDRARNP